MPWASGDNLDSTNLNATIPSWYDSGTGGAGAAVRYVKTTGSDTNDGLTWATAMASVAAAVDDLPTIGTGGQARKAGTVEVGSGEFVETDTPIPVNAELMILGRGNQARVGGTIASGTRITLGASTHLFAPDATFTDFAHNVVFANLTLDGASVVGSFDLLRLFRPGFSTALYNVGFVNAPRTGLWTINNAVDLYLYNCTAASCTGPGLRFNFEQTANTANIGIFGAQIDNCGDNTDGAILIDDAADGATNNILIFGVKFEGVTNTVHDKCIVHRQNGGTNPTFYTVAGVTAFRTPGSATAIFFEEAGAGSGSRGVFFNIHGDGYTRALGGEGLNSANQHVYIAARNNSGAIIEYGGDTQAAQIRTGTASPENVVTAPPGSIYLDQNGGAGDTLFVKESGSGNTGWVGK
jgi:hypothetical protein